MKDRDNYGRRILIDGHQPVGKKPPLPKRFKSAVVNPKKVIEVRYEILPR